MKILHTADWHLGKIVHGLHMTEDQGMVLQRLIDIIQAEQPDVIIIAGDLYDRAVPPREAVELLNSFFTTVSVEMEIPIVAISGNHDSPDRLGFGASLFQSKHLYLATAMEDVFKPIHFNDGDKDVYFHLVPYLEPEQVRHYFQEEAIQTHQDAMERIVRQIEEEMINHAQHILVGHAFIAGGMESESEERLTMIGGTPYIDASIFKSFDYIALGHLHQPQKINSDFIRYCGSIMKYSFSEANHKKSVTILELDENEKTVTTIPLKAPKDLRIAEGYFEELLEGKVMEATIDYLQIRLLDDGQIIDPVTKLRKLFPNILRLERKHHLVHHSLKEIQSIKKKQKMTHEQLFASFYKEIKGSELSEERAKYVQDVIQKVMVEEREK
ncbi:Exodeoxyribonuclease I subunit D [Gracilibacillus orientalis]|uniref:Nuclease SbcCD subunit D n=1 Tax=Gracilibacillus orientalis TaxID=334253 RepID=A0A1I4L5K7_9BACI|nr:exonuclease SbcCD subunit D [Gracilibacillus orientalis]SFL86201.1 Exodeoxyribonuclease I subunit D [Gracilibacillus orientalis]